jgi:hypothetical protein
VFGDGVRPLHFEQALVDAMLAGWARQQQSRMLCRETIVNRRRLVGRLLVSGAGEVAGVAQVEWHSSAASQAVPYADRPVARPRQAPGYTGRTGRSRLPVGPN